MTTTRERNWKLATTATSVLSAVLAKRLMRAGYHAVRKDGGATPFDSRNARFSWSDAVLWAAAAGVGLGVAKVLSARLAAAGWEFFTGERPPE
jgi:hypothetical protein